MIREARPTDVAAIASLLTELGYATTTEAMIERLDRLASVDSATLVFEESGAVTGLIGLMRHPYYELDGFGTEVAVLIVTAEARGRGIGQALMDAAEAWAAEHESVLIWLASARTREDAHRFYLKAGYHDTGVRFTKQLETLR